MPPPIILLIPARCRAAVADEPLLPLRDAALLLFRAPRAHYSSTPHAAATATAFR